MPPMKGFAIRRLDGHPRPLHVFYIADRKV
jgi:hypothetical protein